MKQFHLLYNKWADQASNAKETNIGLSNQDTFHRNYRMLHHHRNYRILHRNEDWNICDRDALDPPFLDPDETGSLKVRIRLERKYRNIEQVGINIRYIDQITMYVCCIRIP